MSESKKFNSVATATYLGNGDALLLTDASGGVWRVPISTLLSQIKVGGRNLLKGTATPNGTYPLTRNIEEGKTYMLSWLETPNGESTKVYSPYFMIPGGNANPTGNITPSATQKRHVFKITGTSNLAKATGIKYTTGGATAIISEMKFEEGNIATDWTPAPEDLVTISGGVICRITDGYVIVKKGGRHERGEDAERCTTLRVNGLGVFRVVRPKRRDNSEGTIGNAAILHDESRNELYNGSKRGDNTRCVAIGREQHTEELATGELGVRNCGSLCTLQHLCLSENHIGYKRKNGNEGEVQLHLEQLARIGIVDGKGVVVA